jgi:hypothetical protein
LRDAVRARDNDPEMTSAAPARVLVVAHRTAATPRLLDEIRARARRSRCTFTLLVPRPYWDPDTDGLPVTVVTAEQLERAATDESPRLLRG